MTWRHDVTSSCKYKTDNIFELSNPKFHRNKKRIIFLAHLQAEIVKISFGASCCDVMTSQCHAVELNQNLSTVSCEWDLGLWKMALLVEVKIFSYKINLILCHNVNFDVTIMTSWRHFFRSTLGWFCRQIISRKSHRRNFLNILPFKSYKQKSKSWVIPPPFTV